jgi:hypothetical protein
MADYSFAKKGVEFKEETNVPTMSILVHSRTVMEKKDYVSAGILTYAEGDMVEVEIGDYRVFELGDLVKMTIYTPAGIFMFNTTVIAKDHGTLIVINPPENRRKFSEKRQHTRIDVDRSGFMKGIRTINSPQIQALPQPLQVSINNISLNGIGFTIESNFKLNEGELVHIVVDFGVQLSCNALIMRAESPEHGAYYGAELLDIPSEQVMALRAFILKAQVEMHMNRKKSETMKRVFK